MILDAFPPFKIMKIVFIVTTIILIVITVILIGTGANSYKKENYKIASRLFISSTVFAILAGAVWALRYKVDPTYMSIRDIVPI